MFTNWVRSVGITGISIRSAADPFAAGSYGIDHTLLITQGISISDGRTESINAELSNTMIHVTANKYVTSIILTGPYKFDSPGYYDVDKQPRIHIGDDEYRYAVAAVSKHMFIDQCDDMPGNDVFTTLDREALVCGLLGLLGMSPEDRREFSSIITWVGPDVDPVAFLTGSRDGTVPAANNRDRRMAATFIDHMKRTRDDLARSMPEAIMSMADRYVAVADESASLIPTAIDRSAIGTIEDAMLSLDALAFTARSTRLADEGRRLDGALAAVMRDIELMNSEHEQHDREVIDSALVAGREREHVR